MRVAALDEGTLSQTEISARCSQRYPQRFHVEHDSALEEGGGRGRSVSKVYLQTVSGPGSDWAPCDVRPPRPPAHRPLGARASPRLPGSLPCTQPAGGVPARSAPPRAAGAPSMDPGATPPAPTRELSRWARSRRVTPASCVRGVQVLAGMLPWQGPGSPPTNGAHLQPPLPAPFRSARPGAEPHLTGAHRMASLRG